MAIAAIIGLAAAGATAYGAYSNSQNSAAARRANAQAQADARISNTATQSLNWRQALQDEARFQEEAARNAAQQALLNQRSVAGVRDATGNVLAYDPATNTWYARPTGVAAINRDRGIEGNTRNYNDAVYNALVEAPTGRNRRQETAQLQRQDRSIADALIRSYSNLRPRSLPQVESALIASNVAHATDPIREMEANATLAALRQGSSSQALTAALARNGQAGTRAAIADARLEAPARAAAERDAMSSGVLQPYATLAARGSASEEAPFVPYQGDSGNSLLSQTVRPNAAPAAAQTAFQTGGRFGFGPGPQTLQPMPNNYGSAAASLSQSLINAYRQFTQPRNTAPTYNPVDTGSGSWGSGGGWTDTGTAYNAPALASQDYNLGGLY